eukprot:7138400-Pyramimonas_sp.AAC.1
MWGRRVGGRRVLGSTCSRMGPLSATARRRGAAEMSQGRKGGRGQRGAQPAGRVRAPEVHRRAVTP